VKNPVFILSLFDTGYSAGRLLAKSRIPIYGFDHNPGNPGFFSRHIRPFLVPDPITAGPELLKILVHESENCPKQPVLVPASEIYLDFVSRYRNELERSFFFRIPSSETLKSILNRARQFAMANASGLDVPRYMWIRKEMQLEKDLWKFQFPLIIKSARQTCWKKSVREKAFIVDSRAVLMDRATDLLERKVDFIIQELVGGPVTNNFEFNALVLDGKIVRRHVTQKLYQYPPGIGTACSIRTVKNEVIVALGTKFVLENGIEGLSNTEFKRDCVSGKIYFIETNARPWQQIGMTVKMSDDYLGDFYRYLIRGEIPPSSDFSGSEKTWVDLPSLFLMMLRPRSEERASWFGVLKAALVSDSRGVLNWSDPVPFIRTVLFKGKARP